MEGPWWMGWISIQALKVEYGLLMQHNTGSKRQPYLGQVGIDPFSEGSFLYRFLLI